MADHIHCAANSDPLNAQPEHALQVAVVRYLEVSLPKSVLFTSSLAGVKLTKGQAGKARAAGLRPGWPDLQFLFPDGVTRYIELKAPKGVMSDHQIFFHLVASAYGDIAVVCRSVDEVHETLKLWCEPLGLNLRSRFM